MRVLHVYKLYSPAHGGGISAMRSLIAGLDGAVDASVLVATKSGMGSRERVQGVPVHRVSSLGYVKSMPIAPTFPFWFALAARRADIVHIHLPFPIADLAFNLYRPNAPVVLHWHSDIVQQVRTKRVLQPLLTRSLQRADKIVVASREHIDGSEDLAGFAGKCVVIPYGVDVSEWSNTSEATDRRIQSLRSTYPRLVLFVGRLVAYKGLLVLLEAVAKTNAQLCIAGEGPMLPYLDRQIHALGIADRVHFLGALSDDELKAYYHACAVFVLPSILRNEAFGLVQLEAMACGKPVVNTSLPTSVSSVARHEREALTVPPNDAAALATAIQTLLDDPNQADRLGAAGHRRVKKSFDRRAASQQVLSLYRELIDQRTAGAADRQGPAKEADECDTG